MTADEILCVVRAKRDTHPELSEPLTYATLRQILAREDVVLLHGACERPAQLVQYWGRWHIVIDTDVPRRRHLYYATHELGHLWLHHDPTAERWERVYNTDYWEGPDPRENDAETFCAIVLGIARYL
jgi:Zn-dependent peptidase ImmA (M78 family)